MTTWRMSMRAGNRGQKMWPQCVRLGVAAITYEPLARVDLSRYPDDEPKELWRQLESSQIGNLRKVAYEMKKGDVIFVKEGKEIVGKGVVQGKYKFDSEFRIIDPHGLPWSHQVPVEWVQGFPKVQVLLGAERTTVKKLTPQNIQLLEAKLEAVNSENRRQEVIEGETYTKEAIFRSRNRALIEAKKANSDYCCEVCGLNFEKAYGEIGKGYIVAHHLNPIASGVAKTTLDDIALVCPNCHVMVHTKNPPLPIEKLRVIVARSSKSDTS